MLFGSAGTLRYTLHLFEVRRSQRFSVRSFPIHTVPERSSKIERVKLSATLPLVSASCLWCANFGGRRENVFAPPPRVPTHIVPEGSSWMVPMKLLRRLCGSVSLCL